MRRGLIVVLAVAAATTGIGACGSDDSGNDEATIKQVLTDYTAALAAGDGEKACGFVAEEGKKQLEQVGGGDCVKAISALSQLIPAPEKAKLTDLEIVSVRIDGDRATAEIRGADRPAQLQKVDDNWLIVDVDAG